MRNIIATLVFVLGVSLVLAQPGPNHPNPTGGPDCDNCEWMMDNCDLAIGPEMDNKEPMPDNPTKPMGLGWKDKNPREIMESIRMWRMTEALDLTSDQSAKLFPKLKDMRQLKQEFEKNRMNIINDITHLLRQDNTPDKDLRAKLDALETAENNFRKQEANLKKDIASILTVKQQARLVLFQLKFDEEMRQIIGKVKDRWQKEPPPKWQFWRKWRHKFN